MSDSDAQKIWGRAAELQEATSSQPMPALPPSAARPQEAPTSGYSLTDVRGSAREAGIATKAIDRALAEYGLARSDASALAPVTITDLTGEKNRLAGEALVIEYEAVVDGEVSERDFDVLGNVIRQRMQGDAGTLTAVGRSLNWSSDRRAATQRHDRRAARQDDDSVHGESDGSHRRDLRTDHGCRRRGWGRNGVRRDHVDAPSAGRARHLARHRRHVLRPRADDLRRQRAIAGRSSARWPKRSRTKFEQSIAGR